jgi:homoserine O-acetyltransferase/O-succinyltransferase
MTRPSLERIRKTLCVFSGALLSAAVFTGYSGAAVATRTPPAGGGDASRRDGQDNSAATQADAWFENYQFRDGETLDRVRIHYATLGNPHRNGHGDIDNAVLVLHWTGTDGRALLTSAFISALFDPGRPLDARRYYLTFADSVGHGRSSKPSDGLRASFPHYGYRDEVDLLPIAVSGRNLLWRRMVIDDIWTRWIHRCSCLPSQAQYCSMPTLQRRVAFYRDSSTAPG